MDELSWLNSRVVLAIAGALAFLGWLGLGYVVFTLYPTDPGAVVIFLALLFLAVLNTAVPVAFYLNRRLNTRPWTILVPLRQSLWVALLAVILVWLRLVRFLDAVTAVLLIVGLVLIEILVQQRF